MAETCFSQPAIGHADAVRAQALRGKCESLVAAAAACLSWARGVVVSHPLSMREALGSLLTPQCAHFRVGDGSNFAGPEPYDHRKPQKQETPMPDLP